ncbi:uncharacterized protein [Ptychodera flava]|uniref:uncharacterized protein n=1 Tax=Ptychodera flava TaxID=63121 RepID=UPI00396A9C3C
MNGYYSESKLGLAILALLTVTIVPALLMVMQCWRSQQKKGRRGVTIQGTIPDENRITFNPSVTVLETEPSVRFNAGSERETSFPIYATVNKSTKHPRKESDAKEDELYSLLGEPLRDSRTQNDQQSNLGIPSACTDSANNYDHIDRSGKRYKQRNLPDQAYYEELKPLSPSVNDKRLAFTYMAK